MERKAKNGSLGESGPVVLGMNMLNMFDFMQHRCEAVQTVIIMYQL